MDERKSNKQVNVFWLILVLLNLFAGQVLGMLVDNAIARILLAQALIIGPVIIYIMVTHQNPVELLRIHKFHVGSAFLVILLGFCLFPVVGFCNALSMVFFTNLMTDNMTEIAGNGLTVSLLIMALLPGVVEEFTFRGVLMGTYDKGKRPVQAILFSALAFAMMHMNFNQMCYAFVLGVIMGTVVELTGSIFSSILIHITINGTSSILTWAMMKAGESLGEAGQQELQSQISAATAGTSADYMRTALTIFPIALIALGICWLLIKAIAYLNGTAEQLHFWTSKEYKEDRAQITKLRVFDIPYGIAMGLCLVMCIMVEVAARVLL